MAAMEVVGEGMAEAREEGERCAHRSWQLERETVVGEGMVEAREEEESCARRSWQRERESFSE